MCLLRTFFLAAFVASLIANGQEEKRASVNQVLRIAETTDATGKLLKVKRQVYPNYLATELAKEAYTWENRSRAKRRAYGNPVAIELAKGGYGWGDGKGKWGGKGYGKWGNGKNGLTETLTGIMDHSH